MEFIELTESQYEAFVATHKYRNFLNAAAAFKMKKENGFMVVYVGVMEKGKIIAASGISLIPWKRFFTYAYCQRGFLLDYHDMVLFRFFHKHLIEFCKKYRVVYITCDPYVTYRERDGNGNPVAGGYCHEYIMTAFRQLGYIHQGFTTGFVPDQQVRWAFVLDLMGHDEESLLKQMDNQRRRCINKSLKQGIKVKELKIEELHIFMKLMDYAAKTRCFTKLPKSYYEQRMRYLKDDAKAVVAYLDVNDYLERMNTQLVKEEEALHRIESALPENINPQKMQKKRDMHIERIQTICKHKDNALALQSKYGDTVMLAGAFYIRYEDSLVYLSAGAYDEFRTYNGSYAIHWYMMRYALHQGIRRYDFYGISGDFSVHAVDHGVFAFKKGFGGVVEEYVGVFEYPLRKHLYRLLKNSD